MLRYVKTYHDRVPEWRYGPWSQCLLNLEGHGTLRTWQTCWPKVPEPYKYWKSPYPYGYAAL